MGDLLIIADAVPEVRGKDMIACAQREISYRERCYPRWVQQGKMAAAVSAEEIRRMKAILVVVEAAKDLVAAQRRIDALDIAAYDTEAEAAAEKAERDAYARLEAALPEG